MRVAFGMLLMLSWLAGCGEEFALMQGQPPVQQGADGVAADPSPQAQLGLSPGTYAGPVAITQSGRSDAAFNPRTQTADGDKMVAIGEAGVPLGLDAVPVAVGDTAVSSLGADGRLVSTLVDVIASETDTETISNVHAVIQRSGEDVEMFGVTSIRYLPIGDSQLQYQEITTLSGRDGYDRPFTITRQVTGTLSRANDRPSRENSP